MLHKAAIMLQNMLYLKKNKMGTGSGITLLCGFVHKHKKQDRKVVPVLLPFFSFDPAPLGSLTCQNDMQQNYQLFSGHWENVGILATQ